MLKRILLASTALISVTVPAAADPVSIVSLGITALLSGLAPAGAGALTIAGLTVSQLASVVVLGAGVAFSALAGGGRRGAIDPGKAKSTFETGNSGVIHEIGRVRIGGLKAFGNTTGFDRYRLIAHCAGPVDGVEEHFLGGRSVVVESDGTVSSPPFAKPGGSYVTIISKIGDGTETAWSQLISAFPALWTSDHRVRGIAQSLLKFVSPGISTAKFLKLYQNGAPDYERIQRGELIFDPREPSHDPDDVSTWTWTDNGILAVLHVMRTFPEFATDITAFDLDFIAEQADLADGLVDTRTGTEPRSRAWGVWDEDGIERGDLLEQILSSTGCEIIARPGEKLGIRLIDDNRDSEMVLDKKHLLSFGLKSGPDGVERPNRCKVKYYSPERRYELAEIDLVDDPEATPPVPLEWAYVQDEIDRVGEKVMDITLPFCPSAAQAQRIARRLFERARAEAGTMKTNMAGLACWGLRTIEVEPPDLGEVLTLEIQPASIDDEDGTVEIPFHVQPVLAAWDPDTMEALPPDTVPDLEYETAIAAPSNATAAAVVTYPDTSIHTRFGYPDPGASYTVEANYRIITAGIPGAWQSLAEWRATSGASHAYVAADLTGQSIEFRHRLFNAEDDGSPWSETQSYTPAANNTAPGAPSVSVATAYSDSGGGYYADSTVTTPNDLQVAYVTVSGTGAPATTRAVKPGEVFTVRKNAPIAPGSYTVTVQAFSSNGTGGITSSANYTI
jgi:hypothetical protein